ncbi:MAG: bacteriohemerythrin [Proteobacteria bacterium]|nr:bacteriohemerythrin [Pseudomonadota bacterium]
MSFIKWSADYETGHPDIDRDHQGIFALINDLNDKVREGVSEGSITVTIEALIDYVNIHFEREETLMEACGYEELHAHKAVHRQLSDRVMFYKDSYDRGPEVFDMEDFMLFLGGWLTNHIVVADMDYVPVVRGTVNEAREKL